ncbi:Hypothetical protein ORPV_107 [Orpheovirus IHUMI-LCC2]|uniref:Uncharacterized protein n=1 Tax=Orpheovirus IHUMI-LCC2 TaxID=2023057 RepID=A0A2I2L3A9_9VIRU|nr:Hypothetical protein ORPV_107 [Orpheovirus IHUMI-LCC2]SNW62011.1 Hypothetical protein ORPV_107 [Orpheovirus IHUMI-LCC2]
MKGIIVLAVVIGLVSAYDFDASSVYFNLLTQDPDYAPYEGWATAHTVWGTVWLKNYMYPSIVVETDAVFAVSPASKVIYVNFNNSAQYWVTNNGTYVMADGYTAISGKCGFDPHNYGYQVGEYRNISKRYGYAWGTVKNANSGLPEVRLLSKSNGNVLDAGNCGIRASSEILYDTFSNFMVEWNFNGPYYGPTGSLDYTSTIFKAKKYRLGEPDSSLLQLHPRCLTPSLVVPYCDTIIP